MTAASFTTAHTFNAPVQAAATLQQRHRIDPNFGLIEQALAGKQSAYTAIVTQYRRMVFALAFDMLQNRDDAEEVTQDAFMKAFRFLGAWRAESRFSTWLYRIAQSSAIDFIRRKRMITTPLDSIAAAPLFQIADEASDVLHMMETRERGLRLKQAMEQLLPDDRTVLQLFYLKEQSLEEICSITGWTMSNAKSRLCRARQRFREILA